MVTETKYRVKNVCPYDIGVQLMNGQSPVIKAGSFLLLSVDDMMFIDSICSQKRPFEQGRLVPVDEKGNPIPFEKINMYVDPNARKHLTEDEIRTMLKGTAKKIEAAVADIEDNEELYNICKLAKEMDLPPSKTKILAEKFPSFDWEI